MLSRFYYYYYSYYYYYYYYYLSLSFVPPLTFSLCKSFFLPHFALLLLSSILLLSLSSSYFHPFYKLSSFPFTPPALISTTSTLLLTYIIPLLPLFLPYSSSPTLSLPYFSFPYSAFCTLSPPPSATLILSVFLLYYTSPLHTYPFTFMFFFPSRTPFTLSSFASVSYPYHFTLFPPLHFTLDFYLTLP